MRQLKGVVKPLKLRALSRALGELMGSYRSAFKDNGIEYDDSRPYVAGDDPRMILWRKSLPPDVYVKTCREERDLRVTLFLDISGSMGGLMSDHAPFEIMKQVATLLVASAVASGDRIALGCFADGMIEYIPHRRGLRHALSLLKSIENLTPLYTTTNLAKALSGFLRARPRRSLLFIITDGIYDAPYEKILSQVAYRHDVVMINPIAEKIHQPFDVGLISVTDPETGRVLQIKLSKDFFEQLEHATGDVRTSFKAIATKDKASYVEIMPQDNPLVVLSNFFERRRRFHAIR